MDQPEDLLANNRRWAEAMRQSRPDFFEQLARQQSPRYLWIGCSDARIPANELIGLPPGEVFVHRNIANQVKPDDGNALAVLQFAIEVLGVRHVIVCGHYGCGGVRAALSHDAPGRGLAAVNQWVAHIRHLKSRWQCEFSALPDPQAQQDRLCELNVLQQVINVCDSPSVQQAWASGRPLAVHGWIYHLEDGLLSDLGASASNPAEAALIARTRDTLLALRNPGTAGTSAP